MTFSDFIMIAAVILGPILAVQAQKYLERRKEKEDKKLYIFRVLMATRATALSHIHVEALNLIDIDFYDDKRVLDAWHLYLDHLANYPKDDSKITDDLAQKTNDLLMSLLDEMAKSVGYEFDLVKIKRGAYHPKGHGEIDDEMRVIRKGLALVLKGKLSIPMQVTSFPFVEENPKDQ